MSVASYLEKNKDRFLQELFDLLRIPSVSADPKFKQDVVAAAHFVKEAMEKAGADTVEICETAGYPIVYGEKMIDPALPTVLVYGHYDVQPADPYELWDSPPFEPVLKKTAIHPEGAIFARGAADDKGQFYMHIKAFEAMMATGALPCNVKFMIEGEEEIGSDNLDTFVLANKERLRADVILISDTHMIGMQDPSITVGLRGMAYMEVEVTGSNRDLHSGTYGGAVANPINVLCKMIASLKDENEHITIPGFYEKVQELSAAQRQRLNEAPFDLSEYKGKLDIQDVHGEKGYSTIERIGIRPTLDVNGIWGGYTGDGFKTVLPAEAHAKVSFRLVGDQNPHVLRQAFRAWVEAQLPADCTVEWKGHGNSPASVMQITHPAFAAARQALTEEWGIAAAFVGAGGSIPVAGYFKTYLGMDAILSGFAKDDDQIHSPNEKYDITSFHKGIRSWARVLEKLA